MSAPRPPIRITSDDAIDYCRTERCRREIVAQVCRLENRDDIAADHEKVAAILAWIERRLDDVMAPPDRAGREREP